MAAIISYPLNSGAYILKMQVNFLSSWRHYFFPREDRYRPKLDVDIQGGVKLDSIKTLDSW